MNIKKNITTPLGEEVIHTLITGDFLLLNGTIFTARDMAHKRLSEMVARGERPPVDLTGQIIYYVGPSPTPKGTVIGSAGPTTSSRMDPFTEMMLKLGVKGIIGKGKRSREIRELLPYYQAVYLSGFGGAGAYLSKRITRARVVAFEDLGPEAMYELVVENFPVIVVNDINGGDLYEAAIRKR